MINTVRLRCTIGWLGMLLPWIVLIQSLCYGHGFPDSISYTYYFPECITPFMIILGSAGLLLFSYKGYEWIDDIICSVAGALALGICLFPCFPEDLNYSIVGTWAIDPSISEWIHTICAFGFFGLLAYNSIFLFTKGEPIPTNKKIKRNLIYKICGFGMVGSFALLLPLNDIHGGVWIVETIALAFFGISWLTKANCYKWLFAD